MNRSTSIYQDIAARTGGSIYIGVVGPVRTGKSTFIKRFMETQVLPHIDNTYRRDRAQDELPQSGSGRMVMTAEPKFVPEEAVRIHLEDDVTFAVRLIDCVGYMVEGAMGHEENDKPRMVKSPWFDEEIPFDLAAETGTRKVIRDHSTIGIVVTTDGTISEIPRENYIPAEKRVIDELEALGKPFVILLNSTHPDAPETRAMAAEMEESYGRTVLPVSCLDLDEAQLGEILQKVLYEFPVRELDFALPRWVTMLDKGHWLQTEVYTAAMQLSEKISRMKDVSDSGRAALDCEAVENAALSGMNLADGVVRITVLLKPEVFYKVLSEQTGLEIGDEAGLMPCIIELAKAKRAYEKIRSAMEQVEATGYGICYFSDEVLHYHGKSFEGQTVVISGSGNVAQYAAEKCIELGGKVVAMSDSKGYIYDPNGINLKVLFDIKQKRRARISVYADEVAGAQYVEGCKNIWNVKCDIAMPCASQNEMDAEGAKAVIANGAFAVFEGANMPLTPEAIEAVTSAGLLYTPGKASNAGGVATSGLEMSQNSMRYSWTFEEVDAKLKGIMQSIFQECLNASIECGKPGDMMVGANVAGFLKVADAMMAQGIV